MNDKHIRRMIEDHRQRQNIGIKSYWQNVSRLLHTQKQPIITCCLLTVLVVLLFGIFSQLQPPAATLPPNGVQVLDYGTFMKQVQARNVLAVTIRGNELHGLLANPFMRSSMATPPGRTASTHSTVAEDIATWKSIVNAGYPSLTQPVPAHSVSQSNIPLPPPINPMRLVYTLIPGGGDASLMPSLLSNHVVVNTLPAVLPTSWLLLLWKCFACLLLVLILLRLSTRHSMPSPSSMDEHMREFRKSRTDRFEHMQKKAKPRSVSGNSFTSPFAAGKAGASTEPPITFADVAGIDEVRVELEEIVQFLRNSEQFSRLGARIPRGALLIGPPGTGKTLLAKAVAGEAGVPFFSVSASEFVEMYVGLGASRVRTLFKQARQSAPCVIFIDELDAVGRQRSMSNMGNDERDQTLNQLLVELDGFSSREAVVVLAATNRPDILDKALLRPGRFDRHITVSLPDRLGREAILKVHTRATPLHQEVSLTRLSRLTTGMSGADLANLVNEAALSAARQNLTCLTHECFEEALARIQLGALRPLVMSEADRRIIAFHEGGHALVAYHLPQAETVNRVTILPRGQSLGVTQFTSGEDRYNYSREALMARIAVGLGGRAAEELAFGAERITTGAENDLQVVTDLARKMVTRWGMSKQLGVVFAGNKQPQYRGTQMLRCAQHDSTIRAQTRFLVADIAGRLSLNGDDRLSHQHTYVVSTPPERGGTSMATVIDNEVQRILNEGYKMARELLSEHFAQLTSLADALIEHEQLDRTQFEELLNKMNHTR